MQGSWKHIIFVMDTAAMYEDNNILFSKKINKQLI